MLLLIVGLISVTVFWPTDNFRRFEMLLLAWFSVETKERIFTLDPRMLQNWLEGSSACLKITTCFRANIQYLPGLLKHVFDSLRSHQLIMPKENTKLRETAFSFYAAFIGNQLWENLRSRNSSSLDVYKPRLKSYRFAQAFR